MIHFLTKRAAMGINVGYANFITNKMKITLTMKLEGEFIFQNLLKSN